MAVDSPVLLPVILCGGSGTRLWPLSRETYPKQFLALTGVHTLLQETVLRLHGQRTPLPVAEQPLLVCNVEHRFLAASQLQDVGIRGASILLEPEGRNTAPALTLAALHASASGADPVLIAMPADHVIADLPAFHSAAADAFLLAQRGGLVAFGIEVDRPETGYGYIRKGVAVEGMDGAAFDIASFSEKPDVVEAQAYLESGEHLWNSGLFMVRASVWLTAVGSCRPDILGACEDAMKDAKRDLDFVRPDAECFRACPTDSIDYAVMERLPDHPDLGVPAYVVPLRAGWSDIGAWDALWECRERDGNGNALVGDAVQHKCADTLLLSSNRLVVGVGLEQIFVVETPDAVLVVDRQRTQNVKHVVEQLRGVGHSMVQTHRKVHRPWGWYDAIDGGERFQVKRIVVNPGSSLSLQLHHHRAEHWVVVRGTARVTCGDRTFLLGENESTFIPLGYAHRLSNPGQIPLEIIEVQSGTYLGEDDVVRLEDNYGRLESTRPGFHGKRRDAAS